MSATVMNTCIIHILLGLLVSILFIANVLLLLFILKVALKYKACNSTFIEPTDIIDVIVPESNDVNAVNTISKKMNFQPPVDMPKQLKKCICNSPELTTTVDSVYIPTIYGCSVSTDVLNNSGRFSQNRLPIIFENDHKPKEKDLSSKILDRNTHRKTKTELLEIYKISLKPFMENDLLTECIPLAPPLLLKDKNLKRLNWLYFKFNEEEKIFSPQQKKIFKLSEKNIFREDSVIFSDKKYNLYIHITKCNKNKHCLPIIFIEFFPDTINTIYHPLISNNAIMLYGFSTPHKYYKKIFSDAKPNTDIQKRYIKINDNVMNFKSIIFKLSDYVLTLKYFIDHSSKRNLKKIHLDWENIVHILISHYIMLLEIAYNLNEKASQLYDTLSEQDINLIVTTNNTSNQDLYELINSLISINNLKDNILALQTAIHNKITTCEICNNLDSYEVSNDFLITDFNKIFNYEEEINLSVV